MVSSLIMRRVGVRESLCAGKDGRIEYRKLKNLGNTGPLNAPGMRREPGSTWRPASFVSEGRSRATFQAPEPTESMAKQREIFLDRTQSESWLSLPPRLGFLSGGIMGSRVEHPRFREGVRLQAFRGAPTSHPIRNYAPIRTGGFRSDGAWAHQAKENGTGRNLVVKTQTLYRRDSVRRTSVLVQKKRMNPTKLDQAGIYQI